MRRKISDIPHARNRGIVYTCAIACMAAYAIPRIPRLQHGLPGTFSMIWILFALLALASNVYFLVGADKERSRMLESQALSTKRAASVIEVKGLRGPGQKSVRS